MKLFLSAIALSTLFLASEAKAHKIFKHHRHYGTRYSRCYKRIYKETYIKGTWDSPGYVKITKKKKEVPCDGHKHIHRYDDYVKPTTKFKVLIDL